MNQNQPKSQMSSLVPLVLAFFSIAMIWASLSASLACDDSGKFLGDRLKKGTLPSPEELTEFELCIKSKKQWNQSSPVIGNSIISYLALTLQNEGPNLNRDSAAALEGLASFIISIRSIYRWNNKLSFYHEIAKASKQKAGDLRPDNTNSSTRRHLTALQDAMDRIPSNPQNLERIRFESLNPLVEQLQKSAQAIHATTDNTAPSEEDIERLRAKLQWLEGEIETSHTYKIAKNRGDLKVFATISSILLFFLIITSFILVKQTTETTDTLEFNKSNINRLKREKGALKNSLYKLDQKVTTLHEAQESQSARATKHSSEETPLTEMLPQKLRTLEDSHKDLERRTNEIAVTQQTYATQIASYGDEMELIAERKIKDILPKHLENFLKKASSHPMANARPATPAASVNTDLELKILRELWAENSTQSLIKKIPIEGEENRLWNERFTLCFEKLPVALEASPSLKAAMHEACTELQARQRKISTVKAIQHHIKPSPGLVKADPQGKPTRRLIHQTRKFYSLLLMLVHDSGGLASHKFSFPKWIRGHFRELAGDIYREHWDRLQRRQRQTLDEAREITDEILSWGHLEVIPTPPGSRFDSRHHIGHSTASRPEFSDGTVAGVVRVGFLDTAKNQVIQKPEVVVNRR